MNSSCDYPPVASDVQYANTQWAAKLLRIGIKAAHPNDGNFVNIHNNTILLGNAVFNARPQVDDLIAIGDPKRYRLVRVTKLARCDNGIKYEFEEIREAVFTASKTDFLLTSNRYQVTPNDGDNDHFTAVSDHLGGHMILSVYEYTKLIAALADASNEMRMLRAVVLDQHGSVS